MHTSKFACLYPTILIIITITPGRPGDLQQCQMSVIKNRIEHTLAGADFAALC
jgi:hypothetical protein